jgi:hypothetical protein
MKFPYVDRGYSSLVPIIPVTVGNGDKCIVTEALVDSGAGRSIFDAQFAEAVGIDDIEGGIKQQFEGISGRFLDGYVHDVDLTVGGNLFTGVSVAFSHDMPDNATNILGQQDFFSLFPIKFTFSKKLIEVMAGSRLSR